MLEARLIWFLRFGQLATAVLFSFVVLGLSGDVINKVTQGFSTAPDYAGLALATSVLTLFGIIPVVIIDFFRKGAVSSFVIVEISWASLLTILWLAAAADTTSLLSGASCSSSVNVDGFIVGFPSEFVTTCRETQAIAAFSWLNFFNLGAWLVFLIVAAIIAHTRGNNRVWFGPVTGTEFFAPAGRTEQSENAVHYPPPQSQYEQGYGVQQGYPNPAAPQMQQQYTGDQVPHSAQQAPMAYPPNNGYNTGGPQVPV